MGEQGKIDIPVDNGAQMERLAKLVTERKQVEARKKDANREFNSEIKKLRGAAEELAEEIESGQLTLA